MATYRIGIGSFNLKDGAVGLGTESSGLGNLKVEGTVKTTDLDVTGVSTFQRYAGFVADDLNIVRDTSLTGEHSTLGDIVVGLNSTFTVSTGATVTVGTVESVSIGTHFSAPIGGVEDRPEKPVEGTVRFNEDLNTLEFYNGVDWRQFTVNGASGRGLMAGGNNPARVSLIEYVNIATKGDGIGFGDLDAARSDAGGSSSSTRGIIWGGKTAGGEDNVIQYITLASSGTATDFGDTVNQTYRYGAAFGSSTRGVIHENSDMEYINYASTGNAIDSGFDIPSATKDQEGSGNSPTRGFVYGGNGNPSSAGPLGNGYWDKIDMVITASLGDSIDFGNLTAPRVFRPGSASSTTRGVIGGGYPGSAYVNIIDFITFASAGNANDFGDLATQGGWVQTSSMTRGLFAGGFTPTKVTTIDYITIASHGNSQNFGNLSDYHNNGTMVSDCHGGLGGY